MVGFQTKRELIRQMVPRYQKASISQKGVLLDEIAATTGYARRYAMWLLNHPHEVPPTPQRQRQRTFGPEVQRALFFVWQHANQICTKRLMPYLATHLEALERHGHLHLTDSCRRQLLSMSAATADRLLRGPRMHGQRGLATTRAGTLLKQQISIRTFEQWNETQPGFLEADVVAHCGSHLDGRYLSTLTLTDIATGWTECLPLRTKSAEAVVSALQQARTFFPFPILGVDTDNGCEFINERLLAYCDTQQITFTRGREGIKNDQNFVEQKNGAVVRQVVGYARFEGEHTYQQLGELYQALHLYINGFQPSMKLQAKQYDGRKVRRIYDAAKTPLQRLVLSHVLPVSKEHELQRVAQVLDPLRLFHHLQELQQVLLDVTTSASSEGEGIFSVTVLPFCIERCLGSVGPVSSKTEEGELQKQGVPVFAPDPVLACQPGQDAHGITPSLDRGTCSARVATSQQPGEEGVLPSQRIGEEKETISPLTPVKGGAAQGGSMLRDGSSSASHHHPRRKPFNKTLEHAIQDYLEDLKRHQRRPKTLEWHTQALRLFQRYVLIEHECVLLDEMTQELVRGWFVALPLMPTATGALRTPNTVESYARSVRAFCHWLVRHRSLPATPFADLQLPPVENRLPHLLEPEEWEQLLLACHPPKETDALADQAAARNRAILWILFETGMYVTEVCRLCLGDVDRKQGMVRVQGKGEAVRWLTLGHEGRRSLLAYLDASRLKQAKHLKQGGANAEPLFLSETGHPLTKGAIGLLFGRLRERVGGSTKAICASLLRKNVVVRYLQIGGDQSTLRELLGQQKSVTVKCSVGRNDEMMDTQKRKASRRNG
jgi:site-specific recombinase XerD